MATHVDLRTIASWTDVEWLNALEWGVQNFQWATLALLSWAGIVVYTYPSNRTKLAVIVFAFLAALATSSSDDEEERQLKLEGCKRYHTASSCKLEQLGVVLNSQTLLSTFEEDPEWRAYRRRVCTDGLSGSPAILKSSYSASRWPRCAEDIECASVSTRIEQMVDDYECPVSEQMTIDEYFAETARLATERVHGPFASLVILVGCLVTVFLLFLYV